MQRAIAVHELRPGIQIWPDPDAVEAEASNQVQVDNDLRVAHRTEIRDERQKPGGAINRETVALNGELLSLGSSRTEAETNQHDEAS
jgi:hypothetical protein